jgi:hypothetical protein
MSIHLHFTEEDWARLAQNWRAWWAGELARPLVIIEGWAPPGGEAPPPLRHFVTQFGLETTLDDILDFYQARLEAKRFYGDAWPKWWPNFGPGIAAGFLGARVNSREDTVWFEPAQRGALNALRITVDPDNTWWQRVRLLTRAAVARWGNQVSVGHTDIGGSLDILTGLHTTQQLALELYDAPDQVLSLTAAITQAWLYYYDELCAIIKPAGRGFTPWASIWSSQRTYMLQCDFAYMISPQMFARFVLPDLATCCERLDHAFYHLDGKGQLRHLDMLLALERLRGIQWIPGEGQPPPEAWLPVLQRIRDAGKLCQLYVSPEGAQTIVRELGGRGFALHIDGYLTEEEANALLHDLTHPGSAG